jgi:hypothetical protein
MTSSECARWLGRHRKSDGRPMWSSRGEYVYRVMWQAAYGKLSPRVVLHHTCGHTWCINLDHLVPLTKSEHALEHEKGGDWGQAKKTHCPSGHAYTDANTYVWVRKDGRRERQCKTCRLATKRRYNARQKKV